MTRGRVVVLGATGRNFAAGMSGGIAYVFDRERKFERMCNTEMVDLESITDASEAEEVRKLLVMHQSTTGSLHAGQILNTWRESLPFFVKVFPQDYKQALSLEKEKQQEAQHFVQKTLQAFTPKKPEPSVLDIEDSRLDMTGLEMYFIRVFFFFFWLFYYYYYYYKKTTTNLFFSSFCRNLKKLDKVGGFMRYKRKGEPYRDPSKRVKDFDEISNRMKEGDLRVQASRCMDCGVPFCQVRSFVRALVACLNECLK
jgi:glutamate synthase (NADPH/NADH)